MSVESGPHSRLGPWSVVVSIFIRALLTNRGPERVRPGVVLIASLPGEAHPFTSQSRISRLGSPPPRSLQVPPGSASQPVVLLGPPGSTRSHACKTSLPFPGSSDTERTFLGSSSGSTTTSHFQPRRGFRPRIHEATTGIG